MPPTTASRRIARPILRPAPGPGSAGGVPGGLADTPETRPRGDGSASCPPPDRRCDGDRAARARAAAPARPALPPAPRRLRCARPPADRGSCSARWSSPCSVRSSPPGPGRPPPSRRRHPLDALRRPAGVRDRAGAAGLVPPARAGDLAGGHAAPGHRPGPPHRLAAGQPRRPGRLRGGRGRLPRRVPRRADRRPVRRGRLGPARQQPQRAGVLLRHRGRPGRVLGRRAGADDPGRRAALPGQDRRRSRSGAGSATARCWSTSRWPTRSATSTTCASWSATGS